MAISGTIVGRGLAQPVGASCPAVPYRIIQPARTAANRTIVQGAITRWQGNVAAYAALTRKGTIPPDVPARAEFGVDVLKDVEQGLSIGVCCHLLAVTFDDRIIGAMSYTLLPPTEATLNLLAVDPRNVPGSPDQPKYRGVGTAMVAALAVRLVQNGYSTIFLHPLDSAAGTFWRGRGFETCGGGSLLCVCGKDKIMALVNGCLTQEDDPQGGHVVLCGLPKRVREKLLAEK